ncbi:hypothetical protein Y032_0193g1401 [Ancylostoma ceylanicum]|uniref:ERAP1-like C-terminal domain-containing protein n=1 Tax=Ancylostoma ceylanicum TaxID=53326 RepID=A0A016SQB7_9BILA|nr:hypothetical protein Y032_0193g1401 [Ancylostoma ceylanicum]
MLCRPRDVFVFHSDNLNTLSAVIYSAMTRYGIIKDAFAAAEVNLLDYEILFKLLEYLPKEKESSVWEAVRGGLETIVDHFVDELDRKWAKQFMSKIMESKKAGSDSIYVVPNITEEISEEWSRRKHPKRSKEYTTSELSSDTFFERSFLETLCKFGSKRCSSTFQSVFEKQVHGRCGLGEKASQCVR